MCLGERAGVHHRRVHQQADGGEIGFHCNAPAGGLGGVDHDDDDGKEPRYYQRIAVQRTIEAIARGQRRVLLVMATGTGKTYTAFQIIWRLWKAGKKNCVRNLPTR